VTPASLRALLGSTPCACGACRPVATEEVAITGEPERVVLRRAAGRAIAVFGDARTMAACGRRLVDRLRATGAAVVVHELAADGNGPHADDVTAAALAAMLREGATDALPVAVGAGTINDLVKAAAHDLGRRYVAVATAPSMNGYTSAIAALTVGGLKSTLPSTPPIAVVADPAVLAASPVRLAVSGLADLLSKPVSSADWKLAHVLWGDPWCAIPAALAGRAVEAAATVAAGVRDGDVAARETLFEALLLSGLSMAVAGTSSPASGGEHLISHFLDMVADHEPGGPRVPALHGEQVGVGTAIATRAWRALARRRFAAEPGVAAPDADEAVRRLASVAWLPETLRAAFAAETARKFARLGGGVERRARIAEAAATLGETLADDLRAAERFRDVLPSIGAPTTAAAIGVAPAILREAWRLARFARDRYTVLDLCDDLGATAALEPIALGSGSTAADDAG